MAGILNVPILRQSEGSKDCGPICVSMILRYYSIIRDPAQVTEEIRSFDKDMVLPKDSFTYMPQLGSYFIKQGFKAEIVTFSPYLFVQKDKEIVSILDRLTRFYNDVKDKPVSDEIKRPAKYFVDFIKRGGNVTVKIPDEADIRSELASSRPILTGLTSNFLYPKQKDPGFNFHGNVITGIDDKYVYVNDPYADERGGMRKHLIIEFLFGIHAAAFGAPDNASILKVKRAD